MDHCDGELARLTGKSTTFGFYYDHVASAVNFIAFFVDAGVGLRHGYLGNVNVVLGVIAAAMMIIIFTLRMVREYKYGKSPSPSSIMPDSKLKITSISSVPSPGSVCCFFFCRHLYRHILLRPLGIMAFLTEKPGNSSTMKLKAILFGLGGLTLLIILLAIFGFAEV